MSVAVATPRSTHNDLARVNGKAELIGGRAVLLMPTGCVPASLPFASYADYADEPGRGIAFGDNVGFVVPELSTGRESFSPPMPLITRVPRRPTE